MKAIRKSYEQYGVENFYRNHAENYENPHFPQVRELLLRHENNIDYSQCLDLACGGGEVSLVLREMGYDNFEGADPFTYKLYKKKLRQNCYHWSFEDIIRGKVDKKYTAIICSFGMHLCPPKQLYPLATTLLRMAPQMIIITPHKRPDFQQYANIKLDFEDFALTAKGKKVRLRKYGNAF